MSLATLLLIERVERELGKPGSQTTLVHLPSDGMEEDAQMIDGRTEREQEQRGEQEQEQEGEQQKPARHGTNGKTDEERGSTSLSAPAPSASTSSLIAAGRLESHYISSRDRIRDADMIAWSVDNLLAVVDSANEIKLVHISSPARTQILSIQERPYILEFHPRGDVLFAAFKRSCSSCIWVKSGTALNGWILRQTWPAWQGMVLDLQWLGAPRKWLPNLTRSAAKGPQYVAGRSVEERGALVICESGQVILFQGKIGDTSMWEVQACKVPVPPHHKVAKAALGFTPEDPVALLAYTLRMSARPALASSSVEGDALGMFFEGPAAIVPLDEEPDVCGPEEGQDSIEVAEIRIDLACTPTLLARRQLPPISLPSFDTETPTYAAAIDELLWLDATTEDSEPGNTRLRLFASFNAEHNTTMKLWEAHREHTEVLSEAFLKLEAAKSKASEEETDDWVFKGVQSKTLEGCVGTQFQTTPATDKLLCSWKQAPQADSLPDISKVRSEYKILDIGSLLLDEAKALPASTHTYSCRPALSPSGTLAALVVNSKIQVVPTSNALWWSDSEAAIYWPAIVDRQDISDILRACTSDLKELGAALNISKTSYQNFSRMMELQAQMRRTGDVSQKSKASRLLLELLHSYRFLKSVDMGSHFVCSQLWTIVSHLEWLIELVETFARQAYLQHASASVSSPSAVLNDGDAVEIERTADRETNVLALLTHSLPRMLLASNIVQLVRFCNWLNRVNGSREDSKKLLGDEDVQNLVKSGDALKGGALWSLADNLRLAYMQIDEVMLRSAVDVGRVGRLLKKYKGDGEQSTEAQKETPKWWLDFDAGDGKRLAREMVEGRCIRAALSLFCPAVDGEEPSIAADRDILTKVRLSTKMPYSFCLSCSAKTQLPLGTSQRCVCGSASWWRVS